LRKYSDELANGDSVYVATEPIESNLVMLGVQDDDDDDDSTSGGKGAKTPSHFWNDIVKQA